MAPFEFPELPADIDSAKPAAKAAGKAALATAKQGTVNLPFNSDKARALLRGSEVTFGGRGRVAANAAFGVGRTLANIGNAVTMVT